MRTTRIARTLICLAIATSAVLVSGQSSPWEATVTVEPTEVLQGSFVYATVKVRNVSDQPVTIPAPFGHCARYCGLRVTLPPTDGEEKCTSGLGCGDSYWSPVYMSKTEVAPGELAANQKYQTYTIQLRCAGSYTVSFRCDVPSSVTEPEYSSGAGRQVSNEEVWHGSLASNEVEVRAVKPEGLDAEVYKAFGHYVGPLLQDKRLQVLRRFPASSYAAELVYEMSWPGMRSRPTEKAIAAMKAKSMGFPPTDLPCTETIAPACRNIGVGPAGTEAAKRNVAWIDFVLQHHPSIWCADQLRYVRAYAAYFAGNEADCVSRLESLSKTASPEVAARACDLLEAMRAEGLVESESDVKGEEQ